MVIEQLWLIHHQQFFIVVSDFFAGETFQRRSHAHLQDQLEARGSGAASESDCRAGAEPQPEWLVKADGDERENAAIFGHGV